MTNSNISQPVPQHETEKFIISFDALTIILSICFLIIITLTISGNSLVIISVIKEKNLRTPSNYLIFSLAIADLLIGILVMPFRGSEAIAGHWPFPFRCDFVHEAKVASVQASTLHLMLISIDRYFLIAKASHSLTKNFKRVTYMILLAWLIPCLYVSLPLLGWHDKHFEERNASNDCVGSMDTWYRLTGILFTFYCPLAIIIALYWKVFMISRKSLRSNQKNMNQNSSSKRNSSNVCTIKLPFSSHAVEVSDDGEYSNSNSSNSKKCSNNQNENHLNYAVNSHSCTHRDKKVAKTLTIITSTFLICWSPFFIMMLFYINTQMPPKNLYNITCWLGFCNSMLNPIIYAYFMPAFKTAFKKILTRN